MAVSYADRIEQLRIERQLLSKAVTDVEEGWKRIRSQEDLLSELQATGHDTKQAERLVLLLKETVVEWERHCDLIKERISYLERGVKEFESGSSH